MPYEDWIDELNPVKKPGYISPREQKEKQRKAFAHQLIAALEYAQSHVSSRSQQQLAQQAYEKLQFDFPNVSVEELRALVAEVGGCLQKGEQPKLLPTNKLVQNVTEAAAASGSSVGTSKNGTAAKPDALLLSAAYQSTSALYCTKYMAYLLSLTATDAAVQLSRYDVVDSMDGNAVGDSMHGNGVGDKGSTATCSRPATPIPAEEYHNRFAQEADEDDFVFEDMSEPQATSTIHTLRPTAKWQQHATGGASQAKMVSLASHMVPECLSCESVASDRSTLECVVECVERVRAHEYAAQLEPLVRVYCQVASYCMPRHPTHMELLPRLWQALGMSGSNQSAASRAAMIGFTTNLAGQCTSPAATSSLCSHMSQSFLPCVAAALDGSGGTGQANGGAVSSGDGEETTVVGMSCQIVELYCLASSGKPTAGQQLIKSGVLRGLAMAFLRDAVAHDAEPLRRAMLFAVATSLDVVKWLTAVPKVLDTIKKPVFQEYEVLEPHGVCWCVVLPDVAAASGSAGQRLAQLAQEECTTKQVSRVHRILGLLADVRKAAGHRKLWGDTFNAQLQQLSMAIRKSCAATSTEDGSGEPSCRQSMMPSAGPAREPGAATKKPDDVDDSTQDRNELSRDPHGAVPASANTTSLAHTELPGNSANCSHHTGVLQQRDESAPCRSQTAPETMEDARAGSPMGVGASGQSEEDARVEAFLSRVNGFDFSGDAASVATGALSRRGSKGVDGKGGPLAKREEDGVVDEEEKQRHLVSSCLRLLKQLTMNDRGKQD